MATNTDVTQLNGLFKEIYADRVVSLIPDVAVLSKMIPFAESTRIGNHYNQPVKLTASQGITYAAADAGAFSLNTPVAMTTKNAQVQGSQMLLRDRISYDAAAKASNGGKRAFVETTRYVVDTMLETMTKRLEIAMLYGGSGIAIAASSSNVDTTHTTVTIKTSEWAVGIWSGLENAQIQFYTSNTTLVSSSTDSIFTIDSMDVDARTVTLSGTTTGIAALDTAISGNPNDVYVYFNGAFSNEMSGLNKIITNTGSLFGIDASSYNLWKGNTHSVTGTLTLGKIFGAVSKAVGRGLNEDVVCLVNPNTWKDLSTDLAAMRSMDSSYKTGVNESGQEAIRYFGQNGKIDIVSHNCVKEGDAFILPVKKVKRIGASDIRFQPFGGSAQDRFFLELSDNAGYELRSYTDQAIFVESPARTVKITGFTNS